MKFASVFVAWLSAASAAANPFAGVSKNDAKSAYMGKLMREAKETENSQLRRLEEAFEVDITGYSMRFQQCQFVKTYSDKQDNKNQVDTILATQRFAIFRLCPSDSCSTCSSGFGEYLIDLDSYLAATVEYYQNAQEEMCQACDETCAAADDAAADGGRRLVDCDTCVDECSKIENMEANGYIDATEFLECQMVYDPEGDDEPALYAGPMCASYGTKINIGVFTDAYCTIQDETKDVESYLVDGDGYQMKLSHALLKHTYATDSCISCAEVDDNEADANGNNDADNVAEVCEQLYNDAAKCEAVHGFANGYANVNGYDNQVAQEELVCDYIQSLEAGTYSEDGEIVVKGASSRSGASGTTGGQKFALSFFIIGTVGLAVYAAFLHSRLTKGGKADLSRQGGAMA